MFYNVEYSSSSKTLKIPKSDGNIGNTSEWLVRKVQVRNTKSGREKKRQVKQKNIWIKLHGVNYHLGKKIIIFQKKKKQKYQLLLDQHLMGWEAKTKTRNWKPKGQRKRVKVRWDKVYMFKNLTICLQLHKKPFFHHQLNHGNPFRHPSTYDEPLALFWSQNNIQHWHQESISSWILSGKALETIPPTGSILEGKDYLNFQHRRNGK